MRLLGFFANLRIRHKLLITYFCLFALALIIGSEVIFAFVRSVVEEIATTSDYTGEIDSALQQVRRIFIGTVLISLLVVLSLTFLISSFITRPLRRLMHHFERAAAGDLSAGAEDWAASGDEIGELTRTFQTLQESLRSLVTSAQTITAGDLSRPVEEEGDLADAFNQMLATLRHIVGQIRDASLQINSAIAQMSAASNEQTGSAAQQSGSISEITTTMTELARNSKEVTESSERVVEIAAQSQEDARSGVEAARETLTAMDAIRETHETSTRGIVSLSAKVQQINEVMDVIDEIADRTKLIAFNAALEAAGAGETGRRFGVVAQEIRRLADTVVEATEDSRSRIVEIQEATNNMVVTSERNSRIFKEGFTATQATADSLRKIMDSSSNTTDSAKQISLSTRQERTALQQVLDAMLEVSEGATLFASKVSETDRIAADLRALAAMLTELIGRYKVDENADDSQPGTGATTA
ncbi:MAG: methyl-accepting chemotaxis protein [Gemmatimonadetes bacterium]|jgi:methyl-accepting chemotaxis protein|nr:methyl-accepting chemotaxis protein [Gemmatimonadota bacterium]